MHKLFRTEAGVILEAGPAFYQLDHFDFDRLFQANSPNAFINEQLDSSRAQVVTKASVDLAGSFLPPIGNQEVWASGVTYKQSKSAREAESREAGGAVFYDMVYSAERPELFFKATARRTRGHGAKVRIRRDSSWNVPEPELTLAINSNGRVFGFTIGNDMSSRSIEGENPLYLPQAKTYHGSCSIGPCLVVPDDPSSFKDNQIALQIFRSNAKQNCLFQGSTSLEMLNRTFKELADYLYLENDFPDGAYLMTGTGIVPDDGFTLQSGNLIAITVEGIGTLENEVE